MILKGECICGTNTSSDGKTFAVTDIKCKIHGFGIEKPLDQTQELLNEARDLMESFDDCAAMTVGYDKKEYTLTAKQMTLIAGALYLVDCKLNQNKEEKMKASELRIGSWVFSEETESNFVIDEHSFSAISVEHIDAIKPIPLTEEWLVRFGFEIKKGAWGTSAEIRIGRVRYVLYQNRNVWLIDHTDGFRVDFKYIHTVQNHYFALTGQELNQNKEDE